MHNNTNYFSHGVFLDDDYREFEELRDAIEYFDSSVALGTIKVGSVVGWLDEYSYETLYNHEDVYDHADCHQRTHS